MSQTGGLVKYWQIEGWNEPGLTAVVYAAAPHESAALQKFAEQEGDSFRFVEAVEIERKEFNELTA